MLVFEYSNSLVAETPVGLGVPQQVYRSVILYRQRIGEVGPRVTIGSAPGSDHAAADARLSV
jgi:hypothetical protein